ncbi:MFS transporter [Rhizobium sp. 16-488-2b]|uniref:CynX/NimT family MFS transporter n=1 Tax=Rhizobium sp. 16-488-2b TaxID=2819991 RepID=UPI001ADC5274|nr:MFS transporter [Rhizobium sp. 16-488-2b]MBO9123708.1 MFS transporter [Rhizobium sp. 16-488-2b]
MSISSSVNDRPTHSTSLIFIGIDLMAANLRAPVTSVGPVLPDIQAALGLDGAGAGALNALPLLIFAILSPVAPRVSARFGLERTLASAAVAIFLGVLMRSLGSPFMVWAGTVVLSAGIAMANVLLPALVKRSFSGHKAGSVIAVYAATMAATAGFAAGLAVPIAHLPGSDWRWSLGAWAILALAAVITWLPLQKPGKHDKAKSGHGHQAAFRSPWKHPIGWYVSLFFAMHSLVFYSIVDWFATYARTQGLTAQTAGVYLLAYQIVSVATNLACAPLIRRSKNQVWLGFGCGILLLAGTAGMLFAPAANLAWIILLGLGAGVAMTTSLSLFALRTRDHHQAAALSGMGQFIGYIGAASGPLLFGILHDISGGWSSPLALLILASILVMVFAPLAGRARHID